MKKLRSKAIRVCPYFWYEAGLFPVPSASKADGIQFSGVPPMVVA